MRWRRNRKFYPIGVCDGGETESFTPLVCVMKEKQKVLPHWCVRWRRNRKFYPIDVCDGGETESFTPLVCAMEAKQKVLPHWCVRWRRNWSMRKVLESHVLVRIMSSSGQLTSDEKLNKRALGPWIAHLCPGT